MDNLKIKDAILKGAKTHRLDYRLIESALVPAALLTPSPGSTDESSRLSRVGGPALLPPDMIWPHWDATRFCNAIRTEAEQMLQQRPQAQALFSRKIDNINALAERSPLPLQFIAQIDMADLIGLETGLSLPSSGILSFFAEWHEGIAGLGRADPDPPWQVFWFPDPASLQWRRSPNGNKEPGVVLQASQGYSIPFDIENTLFSGNYAANETLTFQDFIAELEKKGLIGGNQIGGEAYRLQNRNIIDAITNRHAGFDLWNPPLPGQDVAPTDTWQLLFQFTTDYRTSGGWSGVASFWTGNREWLPGRLADIEMFYEDG